MDNYTALVSACNTVLDEFVKLVTPYPEGVKLIDAMDHLDVVLVAQGQRETDDGVIQDRADELAAAGCPCVGTPDQEDCPHA